MPYGISVSESMWLVGMSYNMIIGIFSWNVFCLLIALICERTKQSPTKNNLKCFVFSILNGIKWKYSWFHWLKIVGLKISNKFEKLIPKKS